MSFRERRPGLRIESDQREAAQVFAGSLRRFRSIDDDDFPGECPYRQLVDRFVGYAFRVNFSH